MSNIDFHGIEFLWNSRHGLVAELTNSGLNIHSAHSPEVGYILKSWEREGVGTHSMICPHLNALGMALIPSISG